MAEFRKSGGFGGGKRPGGFRSGGSRPPFARKGGFSPRGRDDRDEGRPQMFSAKCADCGNSCEVPFRPSGDRPVYCNNCFGDKRESPRNDFARREAPRFEQRSAAFVPAAKPQAEDKRIDELKRQLDGLHKKVDSLVHMMEVAAAAKTEVSKPEVKEEKKQEKPAVVKETKVVKAVKAAPAKAEKKVAKKKAAKK